MSSELNLLSTLTKLIISVKRLEKKLIKTPDDAKESILARFRQIIRTELLLAQNKLSDNYSKKITNYIMLSIILSIDEQCKLMLSKQKLPVKWHDLQIEFFQRSDGGEYFFDMLDDIISNKIYPKLCYETLLIVLLNGFLGRYYQNPNHNERHRYIVDLKLIINNSSHEGFSFHSINEETDPQHDNVQKSNSVLWLMTMTAIALPIGLYLLSQYY